MDLTSKFDVNVFGLALNENQMERGSGNIFTHFWEFLFADVAARRSEFAALLSEPLEYGVFRNLSEETL